MRLTDIAQLLQSLSVILQLLSQTPPASTTPATPAQLPHSLLEEGQQPIEIDPRPLYGSVLGLLDQVKILIEEHSKV